MRRGLTLFGGLVALLICAVVILAIPLPRPLPEPFSKDRNLVAAIITGVLGLLFIGGFTVYLIAGVLAGGREFDPALIEAGFKARGYMLVGREYRGTVRDRPAAVHYLPPYRGQAAVIDITVEARSDLRLAAGAQRPLLDCRNCTQVDVTHLRLAGVQVYAADTVTVTRLLADLEAQAVFSRLLIDAQTTGTVELYVQPQQVWLRAHMRSTSSELLLSWLDDLAALAEMVESG